MIERNENEIIFNYLNWNLFLENIFSKCKNENEIEFVKNSMLVGVKYRANDRIKELNGGIKYGK